MLERAGVFTNYVNLSHNLLTLPPQCWGCKDAHTYPMCEVLGLQTPWGGFMHAILCPKSEKQNQDVLETRSLTEPASHHSSQVDKPVSSRDLSACLWPQNLSFRHTWPLGAENSNLVLDHEHLSPREAPEPTLQGFLRVTNFRVKSPNTGTLSVKPKYQKAGKQEEGSTALQSLQVTDL